MRHGDLRRIGVVGPAGNMALEYELPRHLPSGFAINHARALRPGGVMLTKGALQVMGENAIAAAQTLVRTRPEIILYACTSGSFIAGPREDAAISQRITDLTGVPALTTTSAVLRVLDHLKARSVYLVTPYPDVINQAEIAFLNAARFHVTGCAAHPCSADYPIGAVDSAATGDLILANADAARAADVVFISCTNLLTFDIIPDLERTLGRPVISSNLASLWAVLSALHAPLDGVGIGRLFAPHSQPGSDHVPAFTPLEGTNR